MYAHLMDIQRSVGRENFPLIEQYYYQDHRDMVCFDRFTKLVIGRFLFQSPECQFPCILKVGHAHGGLGKVKVEDETAYQVGRHGYTY